MVMEDIVGKEVIVVIEVLKYPIVAKTLKIKQFNIQDKIVKNYLICLFNYHHYTIHQ